MDELVFLLICLFCDVEMDVEMDLYSVIGLDWVFFNGRSVVLCAYNSDFKKSETDINMLIYTPFLNE